MSKKTTMDRLMPAMERVSQKQGRMLGLNPLRSQVNTTKAKPNDNRTRQVLDKVLAGCEDTDQQELSDTGKNP